MRETVLRFLSFLLIFAATAISAKAQEIRFKDMTLASGIDFKHDDGSKGSKYLVEFMAAGLASLDYDSDGRLDIFFLNGCDLPVRQDGPPNVAAANPLYRNDASGLFEKVDAALPACHPNYSLGVSVADFNNDGFSDLYISNFGQNQLWQNNGDGTFSNVTSHAGVSDGQKFGAGVVFSDFDGDGATDLFVGNYVDFDFARHAKLLPNAIPFPPGPKDFAPTPDTLFLNDGDGTFTDATEGSGIAELSGPSMGALAGDFDQDGDQDIFVACDGEPNRLYQNLGSGKFQEVALSSGVAFDILGVANGSMGVDIADLDDDGFGELLVTDYTGQFPMLFQNFGGIFEDITRRSRIGMEVRPHVNWAVGLVDFDCDQDDDAFVCNGHFLKNAGELTTQTEYSVRNSLMENLGSLRFRSATEQAGEALKDTASSRGAVFEDWNLDGRMDVAILNCNSRTQILYNETSNQNHWLQLDLRGRGVNRDALGTRVQVTTQDRQQFCEVRSGRGYQSHFGSRLHFGLGQNEEADLEICWPSGEVQMLKGVQANQVFTVVQQP
ncbi:MAG: CRTAC1 family protein [Planctomycetota bacterium]